MEAIEWGAAIPAENNGNPLPWLKPDEKMMCIWSENTKGGPYKIQHITGWGGGFKIRLPADHEYYSRLAKFNPGEPLTEEVVRGLVRNDDDAERMIAALRVRGLMAATDIERFEQFHGGLDNNQRDIAEMAIKWARENPNVD